ncbi:MAG: hypothetical protein ACHQ52_10720 [Candidatus Eisenbacteria bacterium]
MLKNLLGNGAKDRELAEEMRTVLAEMREERERFERLLEISGTAAERLRSLGEPLTQAQSDVESVTGRLHDMAQRLDAVALIAEQIKTLEERSEHLTRDQKHSETHLASVVEDAQHVREVFEGLSEKVDVAVNLKDRLASFLEIEKPFQLLRGEADALRGQVEGTGEHIGRLREQHERLVDSHKLAVSKMEALDRRRDELGRDLQDKERRVVSVEQAVRGMDSVRHTVDDVKRELGTLKAHADSLSQKTAALEAQREAVDRALAQADSLERAMRQIDAGIRQQQENEKSLAAMQDAVASLRSLHEQVIDRSGEITQLQRQTEEQAGIIRHELTAAQDEMKNSVERFDFESKGLESVSQRVADLRGALADFENRYRGLAESGQTVGELSAQTEALSARVGTLHEQANGIDEDVKQLVAIRRDLEVAGQTSEYLRTQVAHIVEARPAVDAMTRDLGQLGGAHALVRDALEQVQLTHGEITRMRESQTETRSWLSESERSLDQLKVRVGELADMTPSLTHAEQLTQRIHESMSSIESRREFVDDLHRRVAELGQLGSALDERTEQLASRMEAAEQRFVGLAAHSEEADRLAKSIAKVTAGVQEATRRTETLGKSVVSFEKRCTSVEGLAERTEALREELEQRQSALEEASKNLQRASRLRQEAAESAQQLGELVERLSESLTAAGRRTSDVGETSARLEDRVAQLGVVDRRLTEFESRLAKWEIVDQEVTRSLEQIAARQGTVQALQVELDRMFTMAEKTSSDVRSITSAHREIAESRALLDEVMNRVREIEGTTTALDERKRQMAKAEERLARAEGFLVDVRSSLEALQGQKAIVDLAVEKAGSLKFLLKQAEAMIEGLRDERKMTADVRGAVAIVRDDDDDAEEHSPHAKAA